MLLERSFTFTGGPNIGEKEHGTEQNLNNSTDRDLARRKISIRIDTKIYTVSQITKELPQKGRTPMARARGYLQRYASRTTRQTHFTYGFPTPQEAR